MSENLYNKDLDELVDLIIEWAEERGIDNPILQYAKVNEEVGEIAHELTRDRKNSMEDRKGKTVDGTFIKDE